MPGVIDSLVVALNLDASGLVKGSKEVVSAVEKTKTEVVKHSTSIEGAVKKASESFEGLAGKALAVFAVFAGAKSVEQFTRQITTLDAAVGRLSASMGQGPEDVSAIGKAVERMGGSADTAMGGLRGLSDALEDLRTKGSSAIMEPLAKLQAVSGKAIDLKHGLISTFVSISTALKAEADKGPEGRTMASYFGRQIFGSDDLTNFAMQGGNAVRTAMAQSQRRGVISSEDVQAAQKLQEAFVGVSQTVVGIATKIETALTPYLTKVLGQLDDWLMKNKDGIVAQVQKAVEDFGKAVAAHQGEIKAFGDEMLAIVTAAGQVAQAFAQQSPLMQGLELLGVSLASRLGTVNLLVAAMRLIGALPAAVLAGATAESTPGAGIPADAAERAKVAAENKRLTDEANAKQGYTGSFLGDTWKYVKGKLGFGGQSDKPDAQARDAVIETAEGVKKLVAQGEKAGSGGDGAGGIQGVTASSGGLGGSGRHFGGGGSFPGASLGDHARGGIGRGAAAMAPNARESFEFWKSKGLTPEQAAGLAGMEQGESGFNPRAVGDHGEAHGAFQWHADRRARVKAATGIDIDTATHRQQLEAAYWEFQHTEQAAWAAIKQGKSASDAARSGVYLFERPGDKAGQSIVRGGMAEGWLKRFNEEDAKPKVANPAGAGTPAPSAAAVTDAERFAAAQRILNGSRDPKDREIVKRYLEQQNTPKKSAFLDGLNRKAPSHVAMLSHGAQLAAHTAHITTHHHNDNSSETNINGGIHVHTNATDAQGIVADIGPALKRGQRATQAQYGLA